LTRTVATGAFIFDISQLDQARLSGSAALVQALQAGNPAKNSKDALIGATGLHEQCALITSDRVLRRKAKALGIAVLHGRELLTELGYTGGE
jgi:rRNA-processing protein FCF1